MRLLGVPKRSLKRSGSVRERIVNVPEAFRMRTEPLEMLLAIARPNLVILSLRTVLRRASRHDNREC
jgi:hypothetical protein